MTDKPKTILTGLQPTGQIHLGNYFGAIEPMVKLAKNLAPEDKMFFFVPDLHTLSGMPNFEKLYQNILNNLQVYLASGDYSAENIFFYRQSQIVGHTELAWILSCFTNYGELAKMTQFKDKSRVKNQSVNVGLFTYPVLQAADILLYDAEFIPVGEDQRQHLELARNIASRVNNTFENLFTLPAVWEKQLEFSGKNENVKIRSLAEPERKMSKSIPDPKGTVYLSDESKIAAKKIMSAQTDTLQKISWDWEKQPGITNLLQILMLLTEKNKSEILNQWEGKERYGDFKKVVASEVERFLADFQQNLAKIEIKTVLKVLTEDEAIVQKIATKKMLEVKKRMGFMSK